MEGRGWEQNEENLNFNMERERERGYGKRNIYMYIPCCCFSTESFARYRSLNKFMSFPLFEF